MAMKSENFLVSNRKPLPQPKPDTLSVSEMLTPSEIEQLRQDKKELAAWHPKAFAYLSPEGITPSEVRSSTQPRDLTKQEIESLRKESQEDAEANREFFKEYLKKHPPKKQRPPR
jgi:hypothetical protein